MYILDISFVSYKLIGEWPCPPGPGCLTLTPATKTQSSGAVLTPGRGGRDIVPKYNSLNPIVRPTQLSWRPVNENYTRLGLVLSTMFSSLV